MTFRTSNGFEVIIDEVDAELARYPWYFVRGKNGGTYIQRVVVENKKARSIILAREIMKFPKNKLVDHKDGNTLDNRRCNLRLATRTQNMQNRKMHRNNTSGYKGVCFNNRTQKYDAKLMAKRVEYRLYGFLDAREAAKAYNELAIKHHGEFARLNEI